MSVKVLRGTLHTLKDAFIKSLRALWHPDEVQVFSLILFTPLNRLYQARYGL
jgi:hypothetical protein